MEARGLPIWTWLSLLINADPLHHQGGAAVHFPRLPPTNTGSKW